VRARKALVLSAWLCSCLIAACAAASAPRPSSALPLPVKTADAERELDAFGHKLYAALASDALAEFMIDETAVRALLLPAAASRVAAQRLAPPPAISLASDDRVLLQSARYAELCVQQGRAEPSGGVIGLRQPGFVFERALLVGRDAEGGAIASWVEGRFVHTDIGFEALSVERVESPRRDHADLELAECELRVRTIGHNP
jgi:hypothetical protein